MLTGRGFATNLIVIAHGTYMDLPDGTTKIFPCGRMVCRQKLKISSSMSRQKSSPTELSDTRPTSQSPKATVTEADDKIRIKVDNLVSKSVQFISELLTDVFGFYEGGVSGEAFGFGSAEVFEVIPLVSMSTERSLHWSMKVDLKFRISSRVGSIQISRGGLLISG